VESLNPALDAVSAGVLARVRERLASGAGASTPVEVEAAVRECGAVLGSRALAEVVRAVRADVWGAGPLQHLVDDPEVTDVLVNGPRDVWVDRGAGLSLCPLDLGDVASVRTLAVRLAALGGQRLDDASPLADARLPNGTRLHAVLPPLSGDCALISLRVPRPRAFTLAELEACGTIAPGLAPVLRALIRSRASLAISGATGSGKTTILSALLSLVPPTERIVCIEEAAELNPTHPHVVRLVLRRANVEGAGEIELSTLVRHALRMRPDRLVLGECRGPEVRDVLGALNTGHQGGCVTVHANTAADVPARFEALGALAGMSRDAVAAQVASGIDAVLHLRRDGALRYVAELALVRRAGNGTLSMTCALRADACGVVERGPGWATLASRLGLLALELRRPGDLDGVGALAVAAR
jgi:pilus assembly protein CpaF